MSLEEAIKAEHANWFGKKCKVKHPSQFTGLKGHIYTINKVDIVVHFNDSGEPYMVVVGSVFYNTEAEQYSRYTGRPDLDLEIIE